MFAHVHRDAIREATEIIEFANRLTAVCDETPGRALELAKKIPPHLRADASRAVGEGMTLDQIDEIFSDTLLSAAWQMGVASRDVVRAVVGAPTVHKLLQPGELGTLSEIVE